MFIYTTLKALKAVACLAGDRDIRYYLNGVRIQATNGETRLTATDGHALATYRQWQENEDISAPVTFIMPIDIINMLKKGGSKTLDSVIIRTEDGKKGTITVVSGATIEWQSIDGNFPDITRVIPKECSKEPAQYSVELLNKFSKANKLLGSKTPERVQVWHNGNSGAGVTFSVDSHFFGVIMPMRADDLNSYCAPSWTLENFGETKQEKVAA